MRIEPYVTSSLQMSDPGRMKNKPRAPERGDAGLQDEARLSVSSDRLHALQVQANEEGDVRKEKVEALRGAITSGQYQPVPEKIAGALLGELLNESS